MGDGDSEVDGYAVVSQNTGYIYGTGPTKQEAIENAREFITDEVDDQVCDWKRRPGSGLWLNDYEVYPASEALVDSVAKLGGHSFWRKTDRDRLELNEEMAEYREAMRRLKERQEQHRNQIDAVLDETGGT